MSRKVMVVDDEPGIRLTIRAILQTRGFEVIPCESGQRCIEELEKGFRGVILMDVMMPEMTGWETIREIEYRRLMEGNLICMLTAKHDIDSEKMEMIGIVRHYMMKPTKPKELSELVEECCAMLKKSQGAKT